MSSLETTIQIDIPRLRERLDSLERTCLLLSEENLRLRARLDALTSIVVGSPVNPFNYN